MKLFAPLVVSGIMLASAVHAETVVDVVAVSDDGIRFFSAAETPTFKLAEDGALDWPSFSGFRRYHAECHVCHGPDGEGSTYAPALKHSALKMDYYDFVEVVSSGRQAVNTTQNQVMPAFATNPNVMCYLDDIYTYLLARGTDAVPRGRPAKRGEKTAEYAAAEKACMGG